MYETNFKLGFQYFIRHGKKVISYSNNNKICLSIYVISDKWRFVRTQPLLFVHILSVLLNRRSRLLIEQSKNIL